MKKLIIYFTCLFKGHIYWKYYESQLSGHELWYCKRCNKCQTRLGKFKF